MYVMRLAHEREALIVEREQASAAAIRRLTILYMYNAQYI